MELTAKAPQPALEGADAEAQRDYAMLTKQAEALRRAGRAEAAEQLLAWRDLHAMRATPRQDDV